MNKDLGIYGDSKREQAQGAAYDAVTCPHCGDPRVMANDYIAPTCGKSECQEAAYRANVERNKSKRRKRA